MNRARGRYAEGLARSFGADSPGIKLGEDTARYPVRRSVQYRIARRNLRSLIRLAVGAAEDYQEICGVIVDSGYVLGLVRVRNASRRRGHSAIKLSDYQTVLKAARRLGYKVVGSFHSHPISDAKPGYSDCRADAQGRLLLIIDCIGREARLWRIMRNRRAYPLRFKEV